MKIGIVGLPNVGKSTLFKALTRKDIDISNYPFCTIEPNVGVVEVPDERLQQLATLSNSKKVVPAIVEFVDIAGLVKGASTGEGLGNKFLANIREVDAIIQVVRIFENGDITHVHESINPERDIEIIETELILADMATVDKTIYRLEKKARGNDKDAQVQLVAIEKIKATLDGGSSARSTELDMTDANIQIIVREIALLTMKPVLYIYNTVEGDTLTDALAARPHVMIDAKIEEELLAISKEEVKELEMISKLDTLITEAYNLLELQTFFTTGEDESRAWTIAQGATAPEAGAAIHTDFQDKFICADVVYWQDLIDAGSWGAARDAGTFHTVGKDYIVRDGDVMEFKNGN